MLSIFECRKDNENQIHCKQDQKKKNYRVYNKMVNFCVSRALQGESKNHGTFQDDQVGQRKVNF